MKAPRHTPPPDCGVLAKRFQRDRRTMLLAGGILATLLIVVIGSCSLGSNQPKQTRQQKDVTLLSASSATDHPWTTSAVSASLPADLPSGAVSGARGGGESGGAIDVDGSSPGLYGGVSGVSACDRNAMVSQLDSDPQRAAAWKGASGTSDVGDYVGGMSPVVLTRDTQVTNYDYLDGKAEPSQAVLQSGTAVLIDNKGEPRVRCASGSP